MNPNPSVKSGGRVSNEQKLAILQQWQSGTPVVEVCRTHSLKANAFIIGRNNSIMMHYQPLS